MEGEWMNIPLSTPNCPPGLEYLTTIDQLLVRQKVKLEFFTEAKNKFIIKNNEGQNVYYAYEESESGQRNWHGADRSFDMIILDNNKKEVIHVYRPLTANCCFPDDTSIVEVFAPPGTLIGRIEEERTFCFPSFFIKNVRGETIFKIKGPLVTNGFGSSDFRVMSADGSVQVGKISKRMSLSKMFSIDDYFGLTFPLDLDVRVKALMIGALFLIDILYYENK